MEIMHIDGNKCVDKKDKHYIQISTQKTSHTITRETLSSIYKRILIPLTTQREGIKPLL